MSETLKDLIHEIKLQAGGHKRSTAYSDGVNIALENIEKLAIQAMEEITRSESVDQ